MTKPYDYLANQFEELNSDCGYEAWADYLVCGLKKYGAGLNGLELGCGSGAFCRYLSRAGFCMDGADISQPMLTKAEFLTREEKLSVRFFLADAAKLHLPFVYDFILSPNDCFNYLPKSKLLPAFKRVRATLKSGGIFWFDVSSPNKLRNKVANNTFADDREDVTYLSFNTLYPDRVEMDVTLFVRREDGAFERYDEKHTQYIHEEEEITAALEGAGFLILSVEGACGEEKEGSDRLNFICRKK